jgi:hypothetical protein
MQKIRSRWLTGLPVVMLAALLAACGTEQDPVALDPNTPVNMAASVVCGPTAVPPGSVGIKDVVSSGIGEGEFFGSVFYDGAWPCDAIGNDVVLTRVSGGGELPFSGTLTPDPRFRIMWEFWDVKAGDGPCSAQPRQTERDHVDDPGGLPEAHCVKPGVYHWSGPGRAGNKEFQVDYLHGINTQPLFHAVHQNAGGGPQALAVATSAVPSGGSYGYMDVMVNTDLGSTTYSDTARVEIDAVSSFSQTPFVDASAPSGTSSDWFRFYVSRSWTDWDGQSDQLNSYRGGRTLAKLFYRQGTSGSWLALTNYYDHRSETSEVVRAQQFAGPVCPATVRTYQVGIDLMRPDEEPSDVPQSESVRSFTVTTTCASPPPAPSSLAASGITASGANITWINGTTEIGTTTTLEYRPNGITSWVTVPSTIAAGTTSFHLDNLGADTWYDVQIRHTLSGTSSTWTTQSNLFKTTAITVLPPSNVVASNVTSSSATIDWTNGTTASGTTTRLEYRPAGGTWAVASTTIGEGVTSFPLSELAASTAYEARVNHTLSGVTSAWAVGNFSTSSAPVAPVPSSFAVTSCEVSTFGSKQYANWSLSWEVTGPTLGWSWEIWSSWSATFSPGSTEKTGTSRTFTTLDPWLMNTPTVLYLRLRYVSSSGASQWVELDQNPLSDCAA